MRRWPIFGIAVFVSLSLSCGDDKPTEPVHELVGSWTYTGNNLVSTFSANLRSYLLEQGVDEAAVQEIVTEFFRGAESSISGLTILRINADGTYQDNEGDSGTWSVQGDVVTITDGDGSVFQMQYFVDGDDLTLILNKERFLNLFRGSQPSDEIDEETLAFFDILIGDGDAIRFFYTAR